MFLMIFVKGGKYYEKNIFIFIAGMITTLLIEIIIGFIIGVTNQSSGGYPGLTLFEQDGACLHKFCKKD